MFSVRYRLQILAILMGLPSFAYGQSDDVNENAGIDISANLSVVTDYRFRGISLSNRDPAIQGGVDVSTAAGFFAGTWSSTVANTGGSNVEIDLYGGYANGVAGIDYSVRAVGYVYPGGQDVNYYEFFGNAERTVGAATVKLGLAYIPGQNNFSNSNFYINTAADIALPRTPLVLSVGFGRESSVGFRKWDWLAGLSWSFENLTLSAAYVDTTYGDETEAGRLGRAGAIVSLTADF
ncbi:MAG: TorF family putative porin [Pseudomonadota bacterium]